MKSQVGTLKKIFPARQVALFLVVGGICYLVAISILFLLVEMVQMEVNLANLLASLIAIYVAYVLNKKYIFEQGRHSPSGELAAFYLFSFMGLLLNVGMMFLLTRFVPVSYILSKTFVTVVVAAFNFLMRKFFVFKG